MQRIAARRAKRRELPARFAFVFLGLSGPLRGASTGAPPCDPPRPFSGAGAFHAGAGTAFVLRRAFDPSNRSAAASLRHDGAAVPADALGENGLVPAVFAPSGRSLRPSCTLFSRRRGMLPTLLDGAALLPPSRADRLRGAVSPGGNGKAADPSGGAARLPFGLRLSLGCAAPERRAARQLLVFIGGSFRHAAAMAGFQRPGVLPLLPSPAGYAVLSAGGGRVALAAPVAGHCRK